MALAGPVIHRVEQQTPDDFPEFVFFCPGCECGHGFKTGGEPRWTFNGDMVRPTVQASILVTGVERLNGKERARLLAGEKIEPRPLRCHSFVEDGQIRFLADCTHALAGKTVALEPF